MQIVFGHYPMTPAQLSEWARTVSAYTPHECAKALHCLEYGKAITIRKV
jgi:hypothetical protein